MSVCDCCSFFLTTHDRSHGTHFATAHHTPRSVHIATSYSLINYLFTHHTPTSLSLSHHKSKQPAAKEVNLPNAKLLAHHNQKNNIKNQLKIIPNPSKIDKKRSQVDENASLERFRRQIAPRSAPGRVRHNSGVPQNRHFGILDPSKIAILGVLRSVLEVLLMSVCIV